MEIRRKKENPEKQRVCVALVQLDGFRIAGCWVSWGKNPQYEVDDANAAGRRD